MAIERVVVAGGGTLGSQIAYQAAYSGFRLTICEVNAAKVAASKRRVATWDTIYARELAATPAMLHDTNERIRYATDLETAVEDADLVIEAIPEAAGVKREFYATLAKVAPARTIFTTNSATFIPSQFAVMTGRPDRFLALHFTSPVWTDHAAEIMGQPETDPAVYQEVVQFARDIGMAPILLQREQPGYVINTLTTPFLEAALTLWANGIAEPATIDRAWMIATSAPKGPFGILDQIGLKRVYNGLLAASAQPGKGGLVEVAHKLKMELLDQHRLGLESNHGFYQYPHPVYEQAEFLK